MTDSKCNKTVLIDSGLGGLTVLEAMSHRSRGSADEIWYLGDFANLPYGDKSERELLTILRGNLRKVREAGATQIVLACNTTSSLLNEEVRAEVPKASVHGLLEGFGEEFRKRYPEVREVVVLSTSATHQRGAYREQMEMQDIACLSHPCPGLVELIEDNPAGLSPDRLAMALPRELPRHPQAIILGCTHYPLAREAFGELYPEAQLVDPGELLAARLPMRCLPGESCRYEFLEPLPSHLPKNLSCVRAFPQPAIDR